MNSIEKQIEDLREQASEISELREDVFNAKADITITAVGLLLERLHDGITDLVSVASKSKYYDEGIAGLLKETITEAINAFSKITPAVTVTPSISVNMKPLEAIAAEMGRQNETIASLIKNLQANGNGHSNEIQRLIAAITGRKEVLAIDYSKQLDAVINAIRQRATRWEANVTKRNATTGGIDQLVITSK